MQRFLSISAVVLAMLICASDQRAQTTTIEPDQGPVVTKCDDSTGPGGLCHSIQNRKAERGSGVVVQPTSSTITRTIQKSSDGVHTITVLSVRVAISNFSGEPISSLVAHEWYGGIPPPTDLQLFGRDIVKDKVYWETSPGFQVGNLGTAEPETQFKPGDTISFDIRLNWPGTGSVEMSPLIDESSPGRHTVRFVLFYKEGDSQKFVESKAFDLVL